MKTIIRDSAVALAVVLLLGAVSDPFMLWMPPVAAMTSLVIFAAVMCLWFGFVLREGAGDEREDSHRMHAGRVSYLSGMVVLTLALLVQGFVDHHIDPWIAATIVVMVLSKFISRIYLEKRQ